MPLPQLPRMGELMAHSFDMFFQNQFGRRLSSWLDQLSIPSLPTNTRSMQLTDESSCDDNVDFFALLQEQGHFGVDEFLDGQCAVKWAW